MPSYYYVSYNDDYLAHHGILGMKWGVRRYQNPDGSLTPLGRLRYETKEHYEAEQAYKAAKKNKSENVKELKAKYKEAEYNAEGERLERLFKEAAHSKRAEDVLTRIIQRDIESNQTSVQKFLKSLSGENREVAEEVAKTLKKDLIKKQSEMTKSEMTKAMKVIDALTGISDKQATKDYDEGGYKKLRSEYEAKKGEALISAARERVARRHLEEYYRELERENRAYREREFDSFFEANPDFSYDNIRSRRL